MRWALAIAASLIALVSLLVYTVDSNNGGQPPIVPRGDTASFPDGRVARLEAELRELTTRIESLPSSRTAIARGTPSLARAPPPGSRRIVRPSSTPRSSV